MEKVKMRQALGQVAERFPELRMHLMLVSLTYNATKFLERFHKNSALYHITSSKHHVAYWIKRNKPMPMVQLLVFAIETLYALGLAEADGILSRLQTLPLEKIVIARITIWNLALSSAKDG